MRTIQLLFFLIHISCAGQIGSGKINIYINNSNTPIDTLFCYDFTSLELRVKVTSAMYANFESIVFIIWIERPFTGSGLFIKDELNRKYINKVVPQAIKDALNGKDTLKYPIFKFRNSSIRSDFVDEYSLEPNDVLTPAKLQQTPVKENLTGAKIHISIQTEKIAGFEDYYDGSRQVFRKRPVYEYLNLSNKTICLENRLLGDRNKLLPGKISCK